MSESRFLFGNASGIICKAPPVTVLLESHPGAYTTTRTHDKASYLLFWERHLKRLSQSIKILLSSNTQVLFEPIMPVMSVSASWERALEELVDSSLKRVLPLALKERSGEEELAITTLVSGKMGELPLVFDECSFDRVFDVNVHVGIYVPQAFGFLQMGARLAVVGRGRDLAAAKYSNWVRIRKPLEKLRAPWVTELLLSNDGDRILEGCVTNFFVVRIMEADEAKPLDEKEYVHSFELQTAPVDDGILPGIIRQLVLEVCMSMGIPIREVAPSYSEHQMWEEAFITNSLRLVHHVDTIMVPREWKSVDSNSWKEIPWEEKTFKEGPGVITTCIQKEIMKKAIIEGYPVCSFM